MVLLAPLPSSAVSVLWLAGVACWLAGCRDLEERPAVAGSRRVRRKRSIFTARNVLLALTVLCCACTFFYFIFFTINVS